ncbi:Uncharacterized protein conserved in bacteria [Serratia odorifera]|uniref:Uncharacterized protein conserved in bacteria n=1 Tax=Serratia odorifera TaxID=618 RepID=A0A447KJQ3_SEROD|nr:phage baseplate assembly protein V [Serratia odorifera]VDZ51050.1 Uncharacterized protein conserved in bacteria [Serratia odorifera]
MVAKVAPYRTDPRGKSWNRLPVKVPVLGEEIIWARMGHVYASDHSGVTFYPEAGDEVVLGFVGDMPVIMASLHNPQRKAAIEPDEKNAKKGMVLRHQGQRMELSFHRGTGGGGSGARGRQDAGGSSLWSTRRKGWRYRA